MIEIFGDEQSGNCLKVKWLLDYLEIPYQWFPVDILAGETRTTEFLAINPAAQIPAVRFADGRVLTQSNAILLYFTANSSLMPPDQFDRARVYAWMFWEQYSHEPYLAVRRFQRHYLGKAEEEIDPKLLDRGNSALANMEMQLRQTRFLIGKRLTVADISLLPYTYLAHQGGFDLDAYPAVKMWATASRAHLAQKGELLPTGDSRPSTV